MMPSFLTISRCRPDEFGDIYAVINEAAVVYRGVIAADRWKEPYMPAHELRDEIAAGVVFWGAYDEDGKLAGVMGLQHVGGVALIRHAYTRPATQGRGVGSALLARLRELTERPMLIGTWRAAVRFYVGRGFTLVSDDEKMRLLNEYWTVPQRQITESVVLVDERFIRGRDSAVSQSMA